MSAPAPRHRGLLFIAVFKFIKAAALIAGGIGALRLLTPERTAQAEEWLEGLSLGHGHRLASALAGRALNFLNLAGPQRLRELAMGGFLFASVFIIEGVGLALERRWAEYLTVVLTGSLLPFELFAVVHRFTTAHLLTLVLNIAVVVYLVLQIRVGKAARGARASGDSPDE